MAWLCGLLLIVQSGCTAVPPRLLSLQDRESLGTIGVIAGRFAPKTQIKGPGQRGGKAGLVIGGVGAAAATIASCLNPLAFITCPSMVLMMGALGATAGGVIGHQIDARITGSGIAAAAPGNLDDPGMQVALRDWVLRHVRANTAYACVAVEDPAPASPTDQPDYRPLSGTGIDTVLEVTLLELTMQGRPMQGLALAMTSRIRIIRAVNGAVMGEETVRYRSAPHPYEQWTDRDADIFRAALEQGYQSLAERIAAELGATRR
jgi:hypothetical protein